MYLYMYVYCHAPEFIGVFLNILRALDTFWHEGIVFKLKQMVFLVNYVKLQRNFQRTRVDVTTRALQVSILGPSWFSIYTNAKNLSIMSIGNEFFKGIKLFADYTTLLSAVHNTSVFNARSYFQ